MSEDVKNVNVKRHRATLRGCSQGVARAVWHGAFRLFSFSSFSLLLSSSFLSEVFFAVQFFVRGATTSDCPSVDLTSPAFFISCFLKRLNSLFRSSPVLLAQTDLLTRNCLCVSASLKRPISTKARLIFLNWPSTSSFSWLMKSKTGCRFQSIACFKTWLTDSQLLLVHILPVCVATSGSLRLSRIKVFSRFWKYLTKFLEINCPVDS